MKRSKISYLYIAPYMLLFFTFTVLPVLIAIFLSFTSFNVLEMPKFVGFDNYTRLFLKDSVFIKGVKNTIVLALFIGPGGYIMSLISAWFINELTPKVRALLTLVFYAPSISGAAYTIFQTLFRDDANGWANSYLIKMGIISEPIMFLTNPSNVMKVIIPVILWTSLGTGFSSFVAGLKGIDQAQYEAGYIDGIQNRWQELWHITLPNMKPMLLFGAVMQITTAFNVCDIPMALAGYPSTDYCARTVVTHLLDYGSQRFEMGYASAIATVLFLAMIICNKLIQAALNRVGH